MNDLKFAIRQLLRNPGFTAVAVLTLALGIGANTAMFSVLDVLFLRAPAHVAEAESLIRVYPKGWWSSENRSFPDYVDLRDGTHTLAAVAAYQPGVDTTLGTGAEAQKLTGARATASFFGLLGVAPAQGRFFTAAEDGEPDAQPVVVISHEFWQRHFAGGDDALGRPLALGSEHYEVIGIAPPGFTGVELSRADFWLPLGTVTRRDNWRSWPTDRGAYWVKVIARLKPGVSREAADREANAANQRGWVASGIQPDGEVMRLGPLLRARDQQRSLEVQVTLWLAVVAGGVLVIAATNVAGLLLVRAWERRSELALRQALGASRGRLLAQLLSESLVLGAASAGAALFVGHWVAALLRAFVLPSLATGTPPDSRVWLFTAGVAAVVSLGCGLLSAVQVLRSGTAAETLRPGGREGRRPRFRLRAGLLVAQVAVTVVLLVVAGLFLRSLHRAVTTDLGLDADRLITLTADIAGDEVQLDQKYGLLRERLQSLPGIEHVSLSVTAPFRNGWFQRLIPAGHAGVAEPVFARDFFNEQINCVTPDYFAATGLRVLRGRGLTTADRAGAPPVLVVNESMARMLAPAGDVLGRRFHIQNDRAPLAEVVGVISDSKQSQVLGPATPQYYVPFDQPLVNGKNLMRALLIRTAGQPQRQLEVIRRELTAAVPGLPYLNLQAMRQELEPQVLPWRLGATLLSLFSGLALVIATVGLYGAFGHAVASRHREIGIRTALGAGSSEIVRLVVGQGLRLALLGVVLGLVIAAGLVRLLASVLYGVRPLDPVAFGGVLLLLTTATLLACWLPARRAARVDPMVALRAE